jgi:hypothetical protein
LALTMKIAILGSGAVGQALARGYAAHGHEVRLGSRKSNVDDVRSGSPADVAEWGELAVLAVVGTAAEELVRSLAEPLAGKVLIDATNPLDFTTGAPRQFVFEHEGA